MKRLLKTIWAIASAFKPEEALHNDRLTKSIRTGEVLATLKDRQL